MPIAPIVRSTAADLSEKVEKNVGKYRRIDSARAPESATQVNIPYWKLFSHDSIYLTYLGYSFLLSDRKPSVCISNTVLGPNNAKLSLDPRDSSS